MKEKMTLLAMRRADMARLHPKQDDSHICSRCGERVGIYPSGQRMLVEHPGIEIICQVCGTPGAISVLAPGALLEPFESVKAKK